MRTVREIMQTVAEENRDGLVKAIRKADSLESYKSILEEYKVEVSEEEIKAVFEALTNNQKMSFNELKNVTGGRECGTVCNASCHACHGSCGGCKC